MTALASSAPTQNEDWLVGNPSGIQTAAALWIGSVGLLILGLQPVLLGALFNEHRINLDELGLVATAEIIAIGIGSAVATMLFSTRHLRVKSAILLVALAALNVAMSFSETPNAILLVRTLAGVVEGGMVAVSIELIARSRHAERVGGIFVALQTLAQCVLVFGLGKWVIHTTDAGATGANAGFLVLAAVSLASVVLATLVPADRQPAVHAEGLRGSGQSPLFQELLKSNDPEVKKLTQTLAQAAQKPISQVPLLEELARSRRRRHRKRRQQRCRQHPVPRTCSRRLRRQRAGGRSTRRRRNRPRVRHWRRASERLSWSAAL